MATAPLVPKGPDTPSSDYAETKPDLDMANAILGGAPDMRAAGESYLPKYPNESKDDYKHRLAKAPFTNLFVDIVRNLASKPFSKAVTLAEGAPASIDAMTTNLDGQGNNLHTFAGEVFFYSIAKGVDWICVDYPQMQQGITLGEERAIGARPYFVRIPAERILAVYSAHVAAQEIFIHVRIAECVVERVGFDEVEKQRVRVLDRAPLQVADGAGGMRTDYAPATSTLWELQTDELDTSKKKWVIIEGPLPISIGEIPLVPMLTGKRCGGGWAIDPPLRDIAYAQVHEYQLESNLNNILDLTAFPMLAGNGVTPPTSEKGVPIKVPVGARAVLFAPPDANGHHGEWKWIEPSALSIAKLMDHLETTRKEMRDLGMQPLLPKTGNLTATASALASAKSHSAVQVWALELKNALERAFAIAAKWLKESGKAEVIVHTDFGAGFEVPAELALLLDMRKNNDLSQDTVWAEIKRRGVLSDDFDPVKERGMIAANPSTAAATTDVQIPRG